jgi:DNA-3-methyladenine glycosylase II
MPNIKAVTRTRLGQLAPPYWHEAIAHLRSNDPVMGHLIEAYPGSFLRSRGAPYETLMRSIVGQQISVAAANTVWLRLESKLGHPVSPRAALAHGESIREVGLSARKAAYLLDLSQWFATTKGLEDRLSQMPDYEVIKTLVARPGIGPWTAEMFLMFCLRRPDVFAVADLGLLKAIERLYKRDRSQARQLAENWRPYRTVASWFLWRSLDPIPVEY